jgi:hypothetical protein
VWAEDAGDDWHVLIHFSQSDYRFEHRHRDLLDPFGAPQGPARIASEVFTYVLCESTVTAPICHTRSPARPTAGISAKAGSRDWNALRPVPRPVSPNQRKVRFREVHPLLFATDIKRRERLGVHVVLISPPDDVETGGYACTLPVLSRFFGLREDLSVSDNEVRQMRSEAIGEFGQRLRQRLAVES